MEVQDIQIKVSGEASTLGNIRSTDKVRRSSHNSTALHKGRVLTPQLFSKYLMVHLRVAGKNYNVTVHKLVALAFHGICPDGCEVSHLNGALDNRPESLCYETHLENMARSDMKGSLGSKNGSAKLTESQVYEIRKLLLGNIPKKKVKQIHIAEMFGVSSSAISFIKTGYLWSHLESLGG